MPPPKYIELIKKEIQNRHHLIPQKEVSTIYFGGGTPSLIDPTLILSLLKELANVGFYLKPNCEVTLEINPATIDQEKLQSYIEMGINRFSVGAQSFKDHLLKICGREHNADDTRDTLKLLQKHNLNYSFDLLFALPKQTLQDLKDDLSEALSYNPPHMSLYCLTVPEGHSMSYHRPSEDIQIDMFSTIDEELVKRGYRKYEISNYSKPGFESQHNLSYWTNRNYWGLGLSSHSYLSQPEWGLRFWNPKSFSLYETQVTNGFSGFLEDLPKDQLECLSENEALTDACHMAFRQPDGLNIDAVQNRFQNPALIKDLSQRLNSLKERDWLVSQDQDYVLTAQGEALLNQVLLELCF